MKILSVLPCGLAALTLLVAVAAPAATVTLTWKNNDPTAQGFKIERATAAAGPFTQIATASAKSTTFSDSTAANGSTYYYRVRAYSGSWNSGYTNVALKTCIPAPPAGLTATAGAAGTRKITLTWNAAPGATGYTLYRATASGGTYTSVGTAIGTSYQNTGLTAGATYWYRAVASNAGGSSAQTASVSAKAQ